MKERILSFSLVLLSTIMVRAVMFIRTVMMDSDDDDGVKNIQYRYGS